MIYISLTSEQKTALESRHASARDGRERDRIKAVLLRSEGWSVSMIAQALRKSEASITRYIGDYSKKTKLKPASGGSDSYLNAQQTEQLIAHLSEFTYQHTYQIAAYIKTTYDVEYSVSGLNKWLHQHGFSYKRPKGVPHKFDEQKQAAFIEAYGSLRDGLGEDEAILFMDAVHPTQATKVSCGWIRKGIDKPIETTGSRTRLNLIGAIEIGHLDKAVIQNYDTVNSETISAFFTELKAKYPEKRHLHLILDGAGYHRSQSVKDKALELYITLHYLPPYSANLNPIERLWKVMNEHARNNRYFATAKAFRRQIRDFFDETLPAIAGSLNTRIIDNFQVLKPAS